MCYASNNLLQKDIAMVTIDFYFQDVFSYSSMFLRYFDVTLFWNRGLY